MKVLIGTTNQGKIMGAKIALEKYFKDVEIEGVKVPSNVSEQPLNLETYQGAQNRVNNLIEYAKNNNLKADLFMAVESGITNSLGKWVITNVAVIKDNNGYESFGTSASFPVPEKHVKSILESDLGQVMDKLFDKSNLHVGTGGVGLITHGVITRIDLTAQSFIMALTQFINGDIWKDENCSKQSSENDYENFRK